MEKRIVISHGHIFKNAGSSLDWSLERNFSKNFMDHRDDVPMRRRGGEFLAEYLNERENVIAISSHHMCFPSLPYSNIKIIPLYILRHPIERIMSVYNFEKKQDADTPGAIAAKKHTFREYVSWRMEPEVNITIRDYQCIYLSGFHTRRPELGLNRIILDKAIQNLHDSFCVGIVDRYDESMVVFEHHLKKYFPKIDLAYVRQNITDKSGLEKKEKIDKIIHELGDLASTVFDSNAADMLLYNQAVQLLNDKIKAIPEFERKLQGFKQRCQILVEECIE